MKCVLLACAAGALLRRANQKATLDPYDCYVDNGEGYPGLVDMTESGRSCMNWLTKDPHEHTYTAADTGIASHNYCRNPGGSKERPWCYTVDDSKEWEYCKVPQCPPASETPQQWTAPEGLKSADEPHPCVDESPPAPKFTDFAVTIYGKEIENGACLASKGDNNWLIDGKKHEAADKDACVQSCLETPGAKFGTFWDTADDDGANCGCYRQCVPTDKPEEGAVNYPGVFKLTFAFLQGSPCAPKAEAPKAKDAWTEVKQRAAAALKK